jgi:anti-sigma regulatory factor (Ser/Thr protein kinase)
VLEQPFFEIRIPSVEREILPAADQVLGAVRAAGFAGPRGEPRLKLALIELLTNAVEHGNGFDAAKFITVTVSRDSERARIAVFDEGAGVPPGKLARDLEDVDLESKRGRGFALVKKILGAPAVVGPGPCVALEFDRPRFL